MAKTDLTAEYVRSLLAYDPETGVFRWKVDRQRHFAGKIAGTIMKIGYYAICIDQRSYRAHRLAWLIQTGEWPTSDIDHINQNPLDNRWNNLRLATDAENMFNRGPQRNNKSSFKGVIRVRNRWRAEIMAFGKKYHVGYFPSPEEASNAYKEAAIKLHGKYTNYEKHNVIE